MTAPKRTYLTLPELHAERPCLTVRRAWELIYQGRLPTTKLNRRILVSLEDVDNLLEANRKEATR